MSPQERIKELEAQVQRLQQKVEALQQIPCCRLCGSSVRQGWYDNFICQQDNGHCGELVLAPIGKGRGGRNPKVFFRRTEWNIKTRELREPTDSFQYVPKLRIFYIAGEQVDKEHFFELAKGENDHRSEIGVTDQGKPTD